MVKQIPVQVAEAVAKEYGYDQVVIIARKPGEHFEDGAESVTTYGTGDENCNIAARMGDFIKNRVMKWTYEFDDNGKKLIILQPNNKMTDDEYIRTVTESFIEFLSTATNSSRMHTVYHVMDTIKGDIL